MSNPLNEKGNVYENEISNSSAKEEKINTDGRIPYDWESHYPSQARKEMRNEAIYIAIVLLVAMIGLFAVLHCIFSPTQSDITEEQLVFKTVLFYLFSGLLGGIVYGIKYFYRVVARGYWTQDRLYWRLFSPWISSCVALVIGCMISSGFITSSSPPSQLADACIGFVAGYFADDAVSKMSEVAKALFGTSSNIK